MQDHPTPDGVLARFYKLTEARQERERQEGQAAYHRRLVDAAGIDHSKLSTQGQRILRWLAKWDEWTTGGLEEILTAARSAGRDEAARPTVEATEPDRREAVRDPQRARPAKSPQIEGLGL